MQAKPNGPTATFPSVEREHGFRRERARGSGLEPRVHGRGRGERHLLLENDPDQRREATQTGEQRRGTKRIDDRCQSTIACSEFTDSLQQRGARQDGRRHG